MKFTFDNFDEFAEWNYKKLKHAKELEQDNYELQKENMQLKSDKKELEEKVKRLEVEIINLKINKSPAATDDE